MNRGAVFFLKGVILLIGIAALALCIFWLPETASRDAQAHPETSYLQYPFLLCTYLLFAVFFIALYQAFKLLIYIEKNKAFTELSVRALKVIECCAIIVCAFFATGIIVVAVFMEGDRAGVVALGLYSAFASSIIAAFASVLRRLVKEIVEIVSENELIV